MYEETKFDQDTQVSFLREFLNCPEDQYPILLISSQDGNRDHELINKMIWADQEFCDIVSTCKCVTITETQNPDLLRSHFGVDSGVSIYLVDDAGELFTSVENITNPVTAAHQLTEAVSCYRRRHSIQDALKADPANPHANLDAAFLFVFQRRMHAAITSYRKAIPTGLWQGRLSDAAVRVGDLCSYLGDYETAAELYEQVIHSDAVVDVRRSAWFKLILCYMHMQKFEEAERLGASNLIEEFSENQPFSM